VDFSFRTALERQISVNQSSAKRKVSSTTTFLLLSSKASRCTKYQLSNSKTQPILSQVSPRNRSGWKC